MEGMVPDIDLALDIEIECKGRWWCKKENQPWEE